MKTLPHYLNGEFSAGNSQRTSPVYNPATDEQSAQVALATADETREAVRIAEEALPPGLKPSPLKRARILFKFKALVEEHTDELARLISSEHGKVFSDAKGEVTRGLEVVEFACGIPHLQRVNTP
ncbi:hypothetical protein HSBAA_60510 [Vreelandella sulfidaeris]|uniref:Aldehyde dehydrogenase domain-containing protein n=1 Tax=Vreelandella sulfidaeris TaxID=115553 RepID=A0A455UF79_9GAMM|nr:hypothetical protein HSBAA_60510 [Halomonas sulfidaeris]